MGNQSWTTESFYCPGNFTLNHTQSWMNGSLKSSGTLKIQMYRSTENGFAKIGKARSFADDGTFMPVYNISSGDYLFKFSNLSQREGERVEITGSCMR